MEAGSRYPNAPYSAALALGHAQLESVFFRADVLGRYRDDPRYDYTLDICGEIRAQEGTPLDTYLTTFSIGFVREPDSNEIVVGVPLRYLHDLSPAEQSCWKPFKHERQDWALHPGWVRPDLLGKFPERVSPYMAILMEMSLAYEICDAIGYPALFSDSLPPHELRLPDSLYSMRAIQLRRAAQQAIDRRSQPKVLSESWNLVSRR